MVKGIRKPRQKENNPLISPNQTLKLDSKLSKKKDKKEYKTIPKSKQQIDKEYYQKNREQKKQQRRQRYQQDKEKIKAQKKLNYAKKKEKAQLLTKQNQAKYYGAEAIKVLMTFKQYTELSQDKMKLWTDFNWTLKDCKESINDIVAVMKLEQVAGNLVRDYWDTAKAEVKKGKSWNSLDYDEQQKLIRYWGYEKARIENGYIDEVERLERQGDSYYREIEMAKYHEQRGKIKCDCWQCEEKKIIRKEVKAKINKELKEIEKEQSEEMEIEWVKGNCNGCGEYKKVDSDSGLCKKCSNS